MRADQRKFHYIYKITRTDGSGKYYIGMHSTDDLEDGYFGSGKLLWFSIKKHGKEQHSKEILEFLPSRESLKKREKCLISEELLGDPLCMNLKIGGEGGGKFWSADQQKNASVAGNKSTKRDHKAISVKIVETRRLHGNLTGHTNRSWTGKNLSEEHKAKLRRPKNLGSANSQFGKCWITDGVKSISIKKESLDEYLAKGFQRGRKI